MLRNRNPANPSKTQGWVCHCSTYNTCWALSTGTKVTYRAGRTFLVWVQLDWKPHKAFYPQCQGTKQLRHSLCTTLVFIIVQINKVPLSKGGEVKGLLRIQISGIPSMAWQFLCGHELLSFRKYQCLAGECCWMLSRTYWLLPFVCLLFILWTHPKSDFVTSVTSALPDFYLCKSCSYSDF